MTDKQAIDWLKQHNFSVKGFFAACNPNNVVYVVGTSIRDCVIVGANQLYFLVNEIYIY